jgi:peptide/nickel transport system substrate-binding protein
MSINPFRPRARRSANSRRALGLLAAATILAIITGCSATGAGETSSAPATAKTLTLAASLDAGSFDPALIQNGAQAQFWTGVYDTLLLLKPDATIGAGLAEKWKYNADNTVLTLDLRKNVTFTDGTPFNGDAVKANVEHLKNGNGQNSFMVGSIADVVVKSDYVVELHLSAPDPSLLTYLTMAGGAEGSPAALSTPGIATEPVGSGPYMLDAKTTQLGAVYNYVRNPNYWDKKAFPYNGVKIVVMGDLTARMNALQSGQVDGALGDGTSVQAAKTAGLSVDFNPVNRRGLIISDRAGKIVPALGNPLVRQAINYAIDAKGILKNIQQGYGTRSTQIFNPLSVAYDTTLNNAYPYDPAKAKKLMAQAGYADGFSVSMPENPAEKSNDIVAQELGAIGIKVNWVKVDDTNYVSEVQSGRYGMFWMSLSIGDPWWDLTKQVLTTGPWNPEKSSDSTLDALISTAKSAPAGKEYATALKKVNSYLVKNAWFDIWYVEQAVYLTAPGVKATMHAENTVPYIRDFAPAK